MEKNIFLIFLHAGAIFFQFILLTSFEENHNFSNKNNHLPAWRKIRNIFFTICSGVFSTGAMGALAPAISGQSILSPPFSTRNFGTIYYCQHPQSKSPKYAPVYYHHAFMGCFGIFGGCISKD